MRILENPLSEKGLIEKSIEKYGHTPDHNFFWLMSCSDTGEPKAVVWENQYVIWFYLNSGNNEWTIYSNPIAPENIHEKILKNFLDYLFNKNLQKVFFLDVKENINNFCKTNYPNNYFLNYELIWPVLNMEKLELSLPGGHFKSIRNAKNKFYKENIVEIVLTSSVDKSKLHEVVDRWQKHRTQAGVEEIFQNRYHKMIDNGFAGTKSARAMLVNGKIAGFNAGWETPNTPGDYSAAVGIHDFSIKDLGLTLLLEDLEWIKKAGYKTCDLEGSEPEPLKFKMQFLPERMYKTYSFYISPAGSSGS